MTRKNLATSAIALIILGGIAFYALVKPLPAKAPAASLVLPEGSYVEHAPYYDIEAFYATSTPLTGSANKTATELMRSFIADTITQFKADGNFDHLSAQDIKMMGFDQGRKESLKILYLMDSSPSTASYIFTIYEDTLGAHGNMFFHTFVFNTNTGAPLALSDLFVPGSNYLALLSQISRAKLPAVIGDAADTDFINGGTTPDEKNFQNFFFDSKNLILLFPPYQVGPYSSGPQTLSIPLSDLSSVLRPEYR